MRRIFTLQNNHFSQNIIVFHTAQKAVFLFRLSINSIVLLHIKNIAVNLPKL